MPVKLSNLKSKTCSRHRKKRIGRGNASGHGTYSGRGQKGQRSRSGGKKGLKLKGLKRNIKNLPKLRGFKRKSIRMYVIDLETIQKRFKNNEVIDPTKLKNAGLIKHEWPGVKILTKQGPVKSKAAYTKKKLTIKAHAFSKAAEKAIKKAGGRIVKLKPKTKKQK